MRKFWVALCGPPDLKLFASGPDRTERLRPCVLFIQALVRRCRSKFDWLSPVRRLSAAVDIV